MMSALVSSMSALVLGLCFENLMGNIRLNFSCIISTRKPSFSIIRLRGESVFIVSVNFVVQINKKRNN